MQGMGILEHVGPRALFPLVHKHISAKSEPI